MNFQDKETTNKESDKQKLQSCLSPNMSLIVQNMEKKSKTLLMCLVSEKLIGLLCDCTQLCIALGCLNPLIEVFGVENSYRLYRLFIFFLGHVSGYNTKTTGNFKILNNNFTKWSINVNLSVDTLFYFKWKI